MKGILIYQVGCNTVDASVQYHQQAMCTNIPINIVNNNGGYEIVFTEKIEDKLR